MESSISKVALTLVIVSLLLFNACAVSALKASVENSRIVLQITELDIGKTIEKSIKVNNVNDEPINVRIESSGNFVEINDNDFELKVGESKEVKILFKFWELKESEGIIEVYFGSINGGPEVKIPVNLIIKSSDSETSIEENKKIDSGDSLNRFNLIDVSTINIYVLLTGSIVLLFIILILMINLSKKKKRKLNPKRSDRSV